MYWRVTVISLGHRILGKAKHNKKDLRRAEVQTVEGEKKKRKTTCREPTYRFSLSCSSLTLKSC